MEMKIALAEVVRSVHAIEAGEETLHSQKVILTNRCHEIQAEIRAMEPKP
jgi:chaperonin cofactor prefoldin